MEGQDFSGLRRLFEHHRADGYARWRRRRSRGQKDKTRCGDWFAAAPSLLTQHHTAHYQHLYVAEGRHRLLRPLPPLTHQHSVSAGYLIAALVQRDGERGIIARQLTRTHARTRSIHCALRAFLTPVTPSCSATMLGACLRLLSAAMLYSSLTPHRSSRHLPNCVGVTWLIMVALYLSTLWICSIHAFLTCLGLCLTSFSSVCGSSFMFISPITILHHSIAHLLPLLLLLCHSSHTCLPALYPCCLLSKASLMPCSQLPSLQAYLCHEPLMPAFCGARAGGHAPSGLIFSSPALLSILPHLAAPLLLWTRAGSMGEREG